MATKTKHLGLTKPELNDAADITSMNENWDAIDEQLGGLSDLSTDSIVEQNNGNDQKFWVGTKAEYDAIQTKDPNTQYTVTDEDEAAITPETLGVADYPIEIGTEESTDYTGTWYWEKWKSGKAVCYGQFSFGTINCSNTWGNMKESAGMYKTFPGNLFLTDTIPTYLEISIVKANAAAFVTQDKNDISAQKTGRFTLSRPTTTTGDSVGDAYIGFYAIGRWE